MKRKQQPHLWKQSDLKQTAQFMMFSQQFQYEIAAISPALVLAPVQVMTPMTALTDFKGRERSSGGSAHALAVAALTATTQTLIEAGREGVAVGTPTQITQERAVFGVGIEIETEIKIGTKVWTGADTENGVETMTGEKMRER